MALRYETLDVFTNKPCGGNPLAVVYGAEGLSDASLQKIAREFNYSKRRLYCRPWTRARRRAFDIAPASEFHLLAINHRHGVRVGWRGAIFGRDVSDVVVLEEQSGLVPVDETATGGSSRRRCRSNSATSARA